MAIIPTNLTEIQQAALAAYDTGLCPLRPREDGSKAPDASHWKHYQQNRPTRQQVINHFRYAQGLGIVCGAVSENLEGFEFDDHPTYLSYKDLGTANGLGPLIEWLESGYVERSPSGGIHWLYYCQVISSNTKLAQRPKLPQEMAHPRDTVKTLIEIRGEGGYIIVSPSHGKVHPSGKPYVLLQGDITTIATITPSEREDLLELARSFDQMPKTKASEGPRQLSSSSGSRPGDVFNSKASWNDLLTPHGWTAVRQRGEVMDWRRPGKDRGISATTNFGGSDIFYVFTTSSVFEAERAYSKFTAYTVLEHGGDFTAAAKALAAAGYGEMVHQSRYFHHPKKVFFRVQG